ncbi:MAG: PKD domain-containing protein [Bacteroidetes bacterium]|nr:PKD domain-containing protein [Bacteroidota bacterium]
MSCFLKISGQNTYTVTSTNDHTFGTYPGELRWAINQSEAHPGLDYIVFNITGGSLPYTINLTSNLPYFHDGIVIDGNTQPGTLTNGDKKIHIVGNSGTSIIFAIWPFYANTPPSTIKNLVLANGSSIITFFNNFSNNNVLTGNIIYNKNNVISSNNSLIEFQGKNNTIKGNYFGTDHTRSTSTLFYSSGGLNINYYDNSGCISTNTIGGLLPGEANLFYNFISSATGTGALLITGGNRNKISGNLFVNNLGTAPIYSGLNIVLLNGSSCLSNNHKPLTTFYYSITSGVATVQGHSSPNDFIEIYKSNSLWNDASQLLATTTADGSGNFTSIISGLSQNEKLVVTSTDTQNNTSEFSWPCISQGFLQTVVTQCPGNSTTVSYSATPTLTNLPGVSSVPLTSQITYSLTNVASGAYANSGQLYTNTHPNYPVGSYPQTFSFYQPTASGQAFFGLGCPVVTYTAPMVVVSCTQTISCTSISSVVVTPVATSSCTSITATATIVNNNTSYNPTYSWNFGDGTPNVTGTLPASQHTIAVSHNYATAGTYVLVFSLSGPSDCGGTSKTQTIVVTCAPPPCIDCIGSFNPKPGDTLIVSTWVREQNSLATKVNYNFPKLSIEYPSSSASPSGPFFAKGQIIDGWQRLEEQFIVPLTATYLKIKLECVTGNCLFDDIRVFPKNGSMKSYVYDPQTMRLVAELDERNYATIYEYDEEGKLTRIKKETEKGIMTIQENKSSNSKK